MARKLRHALPGGEHPLRTAMWEFLRPMLPALAALHRDALVLDEGIEIMARSPRIAANPPSRTSTSAAKSTSSAPRRFARRR